MHLRGRLTMQPKGGPFDKAKANAGTQGKFLDTGLGDGADGIRSGSSSSGQHPAEKGIGTSGKGESGAIGARGGGNSAGLHAKEKIASGAKGPGGQSQGAAQFGGMRHRGPMKKMGESGAASLVISKDVKNSANASRNMGLYAGEQPSLRLDPSQPIGALQRQLNYSQQMFRK
jgi:hypothetical protein